MLFSEYRCQGGFKGKSSGEANAEAKGYDLHTFGMDFIPSHKLSDARAVSNGKCYNKAD